MPLPAGNARYKPRRNKLMINKKIMPVEKTKRTVLGIFGKFVADLFDMSHPRQTANLKGHKIRSIIFKHDVNRRGPASSGAFEQDLTG
jgi:hypothetical protein